MESKVNNILFDTVLMELSDKGYEVSNVIHGEALGTNEATAPHFTITAPRKRKPKACPKYWSLAESTITKDKKHVVLHYYVRLSFRDEVPKDIEQISEIINSRYRTFEMWATALPVNPGV